VGRRLKVLVVLDSGLRVTAVIAVTGADPSTYESLAAAWHVLTYGSLSDGPGDVGCGCSYCVRDVVSVGIP